MSPEQTLRTYADLADHFDGQDQPKQRDWFLVLAADAAQAAGQPAEADRLLGRLLTLNPHHLLRPFASFAEALRSPDVENYVGSLRRSYPPARAAQILQAEQGRNAVEPPTLTQEPQRPSPRPAPASAPARSEDPQVIFARLRAAPQEAPPAPPPAPPPPPPPLPRVAPPPPRPAERASPPVPQSRPAPRAPAPPRAPARAPDPLPEPRPAPKGRSAPPEPPTAASPVVPTGLFLLLLLLGLGLTVWTFGRPFLPAQWLP
jgi:hypothetical protein